MAQLDYAHSVLRLNYETLKGLISLVSPSVAKPTLFEKTRVNAPSVRRGSFHMIDLHQQGRVALKTPIAHSLGPQFINFGSVCIGVNSE